MPNHSHETLTFPNELGSCFSFCLTPQGLTLWQDSVRFACFRLIMIKNHRGQGSGRSRDSKGGGGGEAGGGGVGEEGEVLLTTGPLGQSAMGMISV